MKFYIYSNKLESEAELTKLSNMIRKLYTASDVEVGKGKLAQYKQDKMKRDGTFIIKLEDVEIGSKKGLAMSIISVTNVGISEKVLNSL